VSEFPSSARVLALIACIGGFLSGPLPPLTLADGYDSVDYWVLASDPQADVVPILINEILASNSGYMYVDAQGEPDDWIELHNHGDKPFDVGGLYLTDDLLVPTKWQIPTNDVIRTTIAANGYLVIWADRDVTDPGLHADFALSAGGEHLALFDKDGVTVIDDVAFGAQRSNISYGRFPDANDSWWFMTVPTPGAANVPGHEGTTDKPGFNFERGFYDREFFLTMTCGTEGAAIYYTVDGTEPYLADAARPNSTAALYGGPVRVGKTTALRAVAVKPGWQPSAIETRTFFFLADVIRQSPTGASPGQGWPTGSVNGQAINYGMDPDVVNDPRYKDLMDDALLAIPSISLVTDPAHLFDSQMGIYVHAERYGDDWERPVSVELIYPDETQGFQIDAGLRIRGGYSRTESNPKHALRLFFRSRYGSPRLEYPLFGDEGVDEFEGIDLRTSQNYSWAFDGSRKNTMLRDVFSRDTQRDMGQPYTRSRYYHVYLDGQYWGLYETQERSEASYAESYLGGNREDYDVIKVARNAGYTIEATDGSLDAYRSLWEAALVGFATDEAYYHLQGLELDGTPSLLHQKLLDVNNLIDYMLCTFYVGDFDGPISNFLGNDRPNNLYAILNRESPDGFKWFRHDAEHTLIDTYGWGLDRTGPYTDPALTRFQYFTPQWLQQQLLEHPEYRMRFADRVHKHFFNNGVLTYTLSKDRMLARAGQIETAIIAESARWGDSKHSTPFTKADWENEVDRIVNDYDDYGLLNRTLVVLNQLKSHGWYPAVTAPAFSRHGGHVPVGYNLEMQASYDIYYTLDGTDPRLPENAGSAMGGQILVAEDAAKRVLVPTADVGETWREDGDFNDSDWTLVTGSPGGVGYERSIGYESLISLDLNRQMYGSSTGCYIRIPFEVPTDPSRYHSLVLKIRYDDGFVAFLNGVEVQRASFSGTPEWDSAAEAGHEGDVTELFMIDEYVSLLRQGQNTLAIHGLNASSISSDFIVAVSLDAGEGTDVEGGGISPTAIKYTGPVTLDKSVRVNARALDGSTWSALTEAVFAVGGVWESLRISELMYHPAETGEPNDPYTEFVELTNRRDATVNLNLARFANGVDFTFPDVELAPGRRCLVVKDMIAFQAKYGPGLPVIGQYMGSLNNAGERVELLDAAGSKIHEFRYEDDWFDITDGLGFSLTVRDPLTADPNAYGDKIHWRPSAKTSGSPGTDDSGRVPALGSVVINELLANSQDSGPDWVELFNTTDQPIDLAGWFLSDDPNNLTKYEIAADVNIPAWSYIVFYENRHFGSQADPGCHEPFGLSADGETLYLHSGSAGALTGYSEQEKFDASEPNVSLGRYRKSTGTYNFVALTKATPGTENAAPQVGPVVINEIMYHPDSATSAEYVELLNISDGVVTLYDAERQAPWRFTDDPDAPSVELLLPTDPPVSLGTGEYLLLVKDVGMFQSKYSAPADVKVLAWGAGRLPNGTAKIQLSKPADIDSDGTRQWVRVDRVVYSDGLHPPNFPGREDPWPTEANGQGASLSRTDPVVYGNDPGNWHAAVPTPGSVNAEELPFSIK